MTLWEFFKLYIEVKLYMTLYIGIPLTVLFSVLFYYKERKNK